MSVRGVHTGGGSGNGSAWKTWQQFRRHLYQKRRQRGRNENDSPNSGTLVLDATCCPADIAYPWDIDLLNQAREKTVDELCEAAGQKKPRMFRKRIRKDYLRLSKSKKRSGKTICSAVRKQLQYIRRAMGYIAELVQMGVELSSEQADRLNIISTVYEQQRLMIESQIHSVPRRIISLAQPWVRPIVRGNAHANTEFGAKLYISLVDGYARIERLYLEPFNESEGLWFWRTNSTVAARHWPFAKSMASVCPAPPRANR